MKWKVRDIGSPSPRQFLGAFGKVTSPFRRLLEGSSAARRMPPEWLSMEGEVMHGRWKGYNAAIWYPLKEKEILASVEAIEEFRVVCRDKKARYEFLAPELERFVSPTDLEYARIWRLRGARLRVHVSAYRIVEAGIIVLDS